MKRLGLLSTIIVLALCVMASTVLAWTYRYDCNDWPTLDPGWVLATGFFDDFKVVTDPDDPGNNLLHITSVDGPDLDREDDGVDARNRPQIRMDYFWEADANVGTTGEMRIKETAGGIFLEAYDGVREISMETKPPYDFFELSDPVGLSTDSILLEEWNVLRFTMTGEGFMLYANGELKIDGTGVVRAGTTTNKIRFGHSGGSGPADGSPADIWVDYIYFDTTGAWAPGEEPWETAVEGGSWGKIKALF